MDIFVQTNNFSDDVPRFAEVLGGICQNEAFGNGQIEQHFRFPQESKADQFDQGIRLFPEVIHVGRSPDLITQAIANSKLCACGENEVQDCGIQCTAVIMLDHLGSRHE